MTKLHLKYLNHKKILFVSCLQQLKVKLEIPQISNMDFKSAVVKIDFFYRVN